MKTTRRQRVAYSTCSDSSGDEFRQDEEKIKKPVPQINVDLEVEKELEAGLKDGLPAFLSVHYRQKAIDLKADRIKLPQGMMRVLVQQFGEAPCKEVRKRKRPAVAKEEAKAESQPEAKVATFQSEPFFKSHQRTLILFKDDFEETASSSSTEVTRQLLKERNTQLASLPISKFRRVKEELTFGKYFCISLPSQLEVFHSEFHKYTQMEEVTDLWKTTVLPLHRRLSTARTGYTFDPKTDEITNKKFRIIDNFWENQIVSVRHELSPSHVSFTNYCLQFFKGVLAYKDVPLEDGPFQVPTMGGRNVPQPPENVFNYPMDMTVRNCVIQSFKKFGQVVWKSKQVMNLFSKERDRLDEEPNIRERNRTTKGYDLIRRKLNLEYILNLGLELKSEGQLVLAVKPKMEIIEIVTMLDGIFNKYKSFDAIFKDPKQVLESKYISMKLFDFVTDQLKAQKLEPIAIKVNTNQDSYPDIPVAIQDPRNEMKMSKYLIDDPDSIFFTPNFLQMFDIVDIADRSFLIQKAQFNAIKMGFTLAPLKFSTRGRTDIADCFSLFCKVGTREWCQTKRALLRKHPAIPTEVGKCKFKIDFVKKAGRHTYEMQKFTFYHSHPLTLEYA